MTKNSIIKISSKLRNKIQRDLIIIEPEIPVRMEDSFKGELIFNEDEKELFFEVQDWIQKIETFLSTSYKGHKIDCGRFEGVYPYDIYHDQNKIAFYVYQFDHESWRDWFMVEEENAP